MLVMDAVRWRLLGLGLVGTLLAAWASYGPFLWPTCCHETVTPFNQAWLLASGLLWVCLMLVLYARDPSGPMWKLVLLYLAASGMWAVGYIPSDVAWSIERVTRNVGQVVLAHMALAFPTGRLPGRFDRRLMLGLYAYVLGLSGLWILFWDSGVLVWDSGAAAGTLTVRNVFALWPNNDVANVINQLGLFGVPVLGVLVIWRLWRRWQSATPSGRRTLAPVMLAVPIAMAIIAVWHVADAIDRDEIRVFLLNPAFRLPYFIFAAGLLIGIARSRLARGAIADLAVALRRGVPLGGLRPLLAGALRDPTLELAFPSPGGDGFVYADGRPFPMPTADEPRTVTQLTRQGEVLAVLVHDAMLESESPGLVSAVGSVAELALENERLSAQVRAQLDEVRASRARIVEAADAERRRIERDLHDGAQQRLLALATRLQTAKATMQGASDLVDEATTELQTAVSEVRELARGLHPQILTDLGLGPALEALAERAAIPVEVRALDRRYPAAIETAAYFVVSEALTNVARYAGASGAVVTVSHQDAGLTVEITDDGPGGADVTRGTGLRGLVDRVAALGGSLTIDSPAGKGTAIRAAFPL